MQERLPLLLPVAIVLAGAIIGIAIFFFRVNEAAPAPGTDLSKMRPVSTLDHSIGNPEAPVVLVTYSDIDCAYCKQHQQVLAQIAADHAAAGDVLMVYRHFPILARHPAAGLHAEAAECVARLGGDSSFFAFIDALGQRAPGEQQFNPSDYDSVVSSLGLSVDKFEECRASGATHEKVAADLGDGALVGIDGTPFTIVLVKGQPAIPISGALPYTALSKVVDHAIEEAAKAAP